MPSFSLLLTDAAMVTNINSLPDKDCNFSPNIDRQTCCSTPRARMLETHAQRGPDTTSISSIRPASAASADTPRPASAASEEACFSFGRLKSHLPKRTEICPPPPAPPLITPSSLCEAMNEAPSRGAFVTSHVVPDAYRPNCSI